MRSFLIAVLFGAVAIAAAAMPAAAPQPGTEPRLALVIGNSKYETPGWSLENPERDARLMKTALEGLGFKVDMLLNADENQMEKAFSSFGAKLKKAGPDATGFFFFAGHGVQSQGLNYLIPTDLEAYSEADIWAQAPRLELLFRYLDDAGNAANFIVLDACRNNPLPAAVRSTAGGLAATGRVRGTLIAYSTSPGAVAEDGKGGNSEFTLALSQQISTPGIPAETLFRRVATQVEQRTNYRQQPWIESGLRGTQDFCFAGCGAAPAGGASSNLVSLAMTSSSLAVIDEVLNSLPPGTERDLVLARRAAVASASGSSASGARDASLQAADGAPSDLERYGAFGAAVLHAHQIEIPDIDGVAQAPLILRFDQYTDSLGRGESGRLVDYILKLKFGYEYTSNTVDLSQAPDFPLDKYRIRIRAGIDTVERKAHVASRRMATVCDMMLEYLIPEEAILPMQAMSAASGLAPGTGTFGFDEDELRRVAIIYLEPVEQDR